MTAARRVLLVVPFPLSNGRGNSVSSARIVAALGAAGVATEVVVAQGADERAVFERAQAFRPDLVHAIHAFRSGPLAATTAEALRVPLVVSFRGTDTGTGLTDGTLRVLVEEAVARTAVVTTLSEHEAERVRESFPAMRARVAVVPHAVTVPPIDRAAARVALGLPHDAPVVAHVAGIRRVKGFPSAWVLADALRGAVPSLRYVHAGAVLEADLSPAADAWFAARPWALRLGEVPRERALAALAAADISLHASLVEGLSNALLESMALGTVPAARDIPASRAAITDGVDGLLFRDDASAVAAVRRLLGDADLARRLADAARRTVAARFSPAAEIAGYLRAHAEALAGRSA
jgi:glycosyltransferase involved in cell wall biosynthesis